ncbi:hypothetical protein YK56LOC_33690 [Caballeronia sp. HLA56]
MQETVKNRRGHGVFAKVASPILDDAVGCDQNAAAMLVSLVNKGLQQLGRGIGDAFGEEQIIKHEEFGFNEGLEQTVLIGPRFHSITITKSKFYNQSNLYLPIMLFYQ